MPAIKYDPPRPKPESPGVHGNTERVRFDFEGALSLARHMWALAGEIEASKATRAGDADGAARVWRGRFADDFGERRADEDKSRAAVVDGLRHEAQGWAEQWRQAMDEQNRRNRAKQVDVERDKRSGWEKFGDHFVGDDSDEQVPKAPTAPVPQPPSFLATCSEVTYPS